MECPGHLSMVSLGPAHYLSFRLSVVRGLGWDPVVVELDWGLGVIGRFLSHPMPRLLHSALHQKPEIPQRCLYLWICGRNGDKTTKTPLFF